MTHSLAPCRGCGATVLWAVTVGKKKIPLDPDPNPGGNVVVSYLKSGEVRARVLTKTLPAAPGEPLFMPHHATCPAEYLF